jgi:hypothetical protein
MVFDQICLSYVSQSIRCGICTLIRLPVSTDSGSNQAQVGGKEDVCGPAARKGVAKLGTKITFPCFPLLIE